MIDLEAYWRSFEPAVEREADRVLKLEHCYLSGDRGHLLVTAFTIENRIRRKFAVHVGANEGGATVRLDRLIEPERTPGVLRVVAMVAERLRARSPGASIAQHNLGDLLGAVESSS